MTKYCNVPVSLLSWIESFDAFTLKEPSTFSLLWVIGNRKDGLVVRSIPPMRTTAEIRSQNFILYINKFTAYGN